MQSKEKQRLVLSLIKDDLINTKLVLGLNALGLSADVYMLNLSGTIFRLMGYGTGFNSEPVYDAYRGMARLVEHTDISRSHAGLDLLVQEIYSFLEKGGEG